MEVKTYHPNFWGGGYVLTRDVRPGVKQIFYFNNGRVERWFDVEEEGIDLTVDADEIMFVEPLKI